MTTGSLCTEGFLLILLYSKYILTLMSCLVVWTAKHVRVEEIFGMAKHLYVAVYKQIYMII